MPIEHKTHRLSSRALAHLDGLLDEALEQTLPASDAAAMDFERESHDRKARVLDSRTPLAGKWKVGERNCTETLTRVHQRSSAYSSRRCEAN
jgi:ketosteroid isomerase-like protein